MAITFNTNVSALTAQRYLGIAGDKTASSLAKLSSGSRVPTAKDDAAGLAIGSKLRAEVAGLNQAANNAAQAVSLLQIADGALSTVGDILVRMKSLATQSSSGQLADAERSLLNQEFTNLRTEIDRIANITNFNGTTLLNGGDVRAESGELKDGGLSSRGIRVSFDTSVVYDADTTNATGAGDISDSFAIDYAYAANGTSADSGTLTVYNLRTGASQSVDVASVIRAKTGESGTTMTTDLSPGQEVTVDFGAVGVKVTLDSNFDVDEGTTAISYGATEASYSGDADVTTALTVTNVNNGGLTDRVIDLLRTSSFYNESTGQLTLNIEEDDESSTDTIRFSAIDNIRFDVNGAAGTENNPTALINVDTNFTVDVYFDDGADSAKLFTLEFAAQNATTAITGDTTADASYVVNFGDLVFGADEIATSTKTFNFKVGTGNGTTDTNNVVGFTLSAATNASLGISSASVDTQSNADAAITTLAAAITTVSSRRADIGANQSRLDFAAASVNVAIENTTAAQSALLDVDVSQEITDFTSQQVLLQAGVSLLAQANQQPALLLRLLQ